MGQYSYLLSILLEVTHALTHIRVLFYIHAFSPNNILGRPFLALGRALIDVQKGEFRLRVQEEEVTFNVFNTTKLLMKKIAALVLML